MTFNATMIWALLFAVLCPGLLYAQHYKAETRCTGGIATSDAPHPGVSALDSTETVAHEAVHRRQLAVGCDSVLALWSTDLAAKMTAEAQALCMGMRAANLSDVERKRRAVQAALWWSQFRGQWSFAEYLAMFDLWCLP